MTPARVLIVEDDWLIARDHAAVLERAGHVVVGPAATVSAALLLIQSEKVDAALLDFHLSGDTSSALAGALRRAGIPYAVLSGQARRHLPKDLADTLFIDKPVEPHGLLATVALLTEKR